MACRTDCITNAMKEYNNINENCYYCNNVGQHIIMESVDVSDESGITEGEVPCGEEWWCELGLDLTAKTCDKLDKTQTEGIENDEGSGR